MSKKSLIIQLCLMLLMSGCWNYAEVDDLGIIFGLGITGQDSVYHLVAESISIQPGQDPQFSPHLIVSQGQSMFDGVRNMALKAGRRLFWSHAMITLVDEQYARTNGLLSVLDWVLRDAEVRPDVFLAIASKENTPLEIFEAGPELNSNISEKLVGLMDAHRFAPKFVPKELWQFKQEISAPGISATLPTVRLVENAGELVPEMWGTAVFRHDRMIGWLDGPESLIFSYLLPIPAFGLIVTDTTVHDRPGSITYEVFGKATTYSVQEEAGKPIMNVQTKLQVGVADLDGLKPDIEDPMVLRKLEEEIVSHLENRMNKLISRVQQEYQSDIFGFGAEIRRQRPDLWRKLEANWSQDFSELEVRVAVDATIRATAIVKRPITMRD